MSKNMDNNIAIIIISTETMCILNNIINSEDKSKSPKKSPKKSLTKQPTKEDIVNIQNIFISEYNEQRRNNKFNK